MKTIPVLILSIFLGSLIIYNKYVDRHPLKVFINLPFDKQLRFFPEFEKWISKNKGKFDMIPLYYGYDPYFVFTKDFEYDSTNSETI